MSRVFESLLFCLLNASFLVVVHSDSRSISTLSKYSALLKCILIFGVVFRVLLCAVERKSGHVTSGISETGTSLRLLFAR